jgi:uncharacterized membrane protein YoaK (UPF0700 family)
VEKVPAFYTQLQQFCKSLTCPFSWKKQLKKRRTGSFSRVSSSFFSLATAGNLIQNRNRLHLFFNCRVHIFIAFLCCIKILEKYQTKS